MNKILLALIPALLLSNHIQANSYCDSRPTNAARNDCYRVGIEFQVSSMGSNYKKLTDPQRHSEQEVNLLKQDHNNWETQVKQQCQQSEACILQSFMNRNDYLTKLIAANQEETQASNSSPIEECQALWISAYQAEIGEDAMINSEQLNEWKKWCSEGKQP